MHYPVIAVYDANVLYQASLRDLFVRLALAGLVSLFDAAPGPVCGAVKRLREGLRNPSKTAEELLATLENRGLVQTVSRVQQFSDLLPPFSAVWQDDHKR